MLCRGRLHQLGEVLPPLQTAREYHPEHPERRGEARSRGFCFCSTRCRQTANWLLRATMVAAAWALGATKAETKRKA
jgi:hypothetical protein